MSESESKIEVVNTKDAYRPLGDVFKAIDDLDGHDVAKISIEYDNNVGQWRLDAELVRRESWSVFSEKPGSFANLIAKMHEFMNKKSEANE